MDSPAGNEKVKAKEAAKALLVWFRFDFANSQDKDTSSHEQIERVRFGCFFSNSRRVDAFLKGCRRSRTSGGGTEVGGDSALIHGLFAEILELKEQIWQMSQEPMYIYTVYIY